MPQSKIQAVQQTTQQQITQQQIRFLELLQLSAEEIEGRIEREIEENPVLEEIQPSEQLEDVQKLLSDAKSYTSSSDFSQQSYTSSSDFSQQSSSETQLGQRIASTESLSEHLITQVGFFSLPELEQNIAEQIIGSLEEDGYLRRPLLAIQQDLRKRGSYPRLPQIEEVLYQVQSLDPAGIAARSLQECLLIQLAQLHEQPAQKIALQIIKEHYDTFTKKALSAHRSEATTL